MAKSKHPCSLNPPDGLCRLPARTPGVLGLFDQSDPNLTTLLGDTPGSLGLNDYADFNLRCVDFPILPLLNFAVRGPDGVALSTGLTGPAVTAATTAKTAVRDEKLWVAWTPPAGYDVLYEMLAANEGNIPHMYLDDTGKVTVGIGTYLPTVAEAKKLRFYNRETQAMATAAEIETDFNAVLAAKPDPEKYPHGKKATAYGKDTKLDMTPTDIGERWLADVKAFQGYLRPEFPGFANYPADAKQALTDIAYQYGAHGAAVNYALGKVREYAEKGDWAAAAKACAGVSRDLDRNKRRKEMFEAAAKAAPLKPASPAGTSPKP